MSHFDTFVDEVAAECVSADISMDRAQIKKELSATLAGQQFIWADHADDLREELLASLPGKLLRRVVSYLASIMR